MSRSLQLREKDKQLIISNLATLLKAGIPIIEAIESIARESRGEAKRFLNIAIQCLDEGKPFSDAMLKAPKAFDPVSVSLVRAAEESGNLDECLLELSKSYKHQAAFRSKLRSSMLYPAFIMVLFTAVLLMILTFVVPRLGKVYASLHIPTPTATKVLISSSNFLTQNYKAIAIGFVLFLIAIAVIYTYQRKAVLRLIMQLPLFKQLGIQIDVARFTHTLAELLKAGIPIIEALDTAGHVVINKEVKAMSEECKTAVASGEPLSEGMRKHHTVISDMMIQLVSAGEKSGSLETIMQGISEQYETDVRRRLKNIATLLEPVALVVVGLIVGGLMFSIMGPMFKMMNQLNTLQQ